MSTLLLDASQNTVFTLLMNGEKFLFWTLPARDFQRDFLNGLGEKLFKLHEKPLDLNRILVGMGPGSFTGVRSAVSTARALAFASGAEILGLSSMELFALSRIESANNGEFLIPVIDGRMGKVFTAIFQKKEGALIRQTEDLDLLPEELSEMISEKKSGLIFGSGLKSYKESFQNLSAEILSHEDEMTESGLRIALQSENLNRGFNSVFPVYLRKSQAERALEEK